jgi:hypothetical protein
MLNMNPITNSVSASHSRTGLYVKGRNGLKIRDQRTTRLVNRMRAAMPWITDADLPACRAWAHFELLCDRVYAKLRDDGLFNVEGDGRRLLDDYRRLRATQLLFSRELGLTPAARLAIKAGSKDEPVDLF